MTWQPPAGFAPAPSAVEGVAWFSPPSGAGSAPRCGRCGGHAVDGACPVCGADGLPAAGWPASRAARSCGACAARVVATVGVVCPLCGGETTASEPLEAPPAAVAPFSVGAESAQRALARWLGGGWFHPWRLRRLLRAGSLQAVFVPCWVLEGRVDAEWRGRVGHERVERVFDPAAGAWETRARVDWRWQTGRVRDRVVELVPATPHLPPRALELLRVTFDPAELHPFDAGPSEPGLEPELSLGRARGEGRRVLRGRIRDRCRAEVPAPLLRDLSVSEDLVDEAWRLVWLPVLVGAWWDRGVRRVVVVHGRTGEVVGARPVDWARVRLVVAIALLPGALAVLAGVPLLLVFAVGVPTMLFGLFALALGSGLSILVWSAALASEGE